MMKQRLGQHNNSNQERTIKLLVGEELDALERGGLPAVAACGAIPAFVDWTISGTGRRRSSLMRSSRPRGSSDLQLSLFFGGFGRVEKELVAVLVSLAR